MEARQRNIQKELSALKKKLTNHKVNINADQLDWPEVFSLSTLLFKLKEVNQCFKI